MSRRQATTLGSIAVMRACSWLLSGDCACAGAPRAAVSAARGRKIAVAPLIIAHLRMSGTAPLHGYDATRAERRQSGAPVAPARAIRIRADCYAWQGVHGDKDELLEWQTKELLARQAHRDGHVVYVRPELVVEIAFNEVQKSPHYPGGVALRFARVKGYRPDKQPSEADTIDAVRSFLI